MALEQNIVDVQISLDTTPVTRAGFGTPVFASEHRWFPERVRLYTSISTLAEDVPTDSNEYAAALGFFNADISPSVIKIGRRKVDSITYTPEAATAIGQVYSITVSGTDDVKVSSTFVTLTGSETATTIATALVAGLAALVGVDVADNTGSFTLSGTAGADDWFVSGTPTEKPSRLTALNTTTETAADLLTAVEAVDNEWYYMTSNDHSDTFINTPTTGMAAAIGARDKLFVTSSQAAATLTAWTGTAGAGDVLGKLTEDQRENSIGLFTDDADTVFPECYYISRFAPKRPGTTVWGSKPIGLGASRNPTTGNFLSASERENLGRRNMNFIQEQGGVAIVRTGVSATGEDIENLRFRDFYMARLTEAYQLDAINKEKTPFTDSGINAKRNIYETVSSRYVTTPGNAQGLQEAPAFISNFPLRKDIDPNLIIAGTLEASFIAYLSGSIKTMILRGSLTFEGLTS